jgi:hypothetical protein
MRRLAILAILLSAAALAAPARAQDTAASDCDPISGLIFRGAQPALRQVAPGVGRLHFAMNGSARAGCPNAHAACAERAFLVPGDPVVVIGTTGAYACAAFTSRAPGARPSSGWLPSAALVPVPAPRRAEQQADDDWLGDWRYGSQQRIRIRHRLDGRMALDGDATFGADDPARVRRGAVNTGDFSAIVAPARGYLGFLVGDKGEALPYDAQRAKDETLCGLRMWRTGPYLVVADNLLCGGNNVTFTGIYRRRGRPS